MSTHGPLQEMLNKARKVYDDEMAEVEKYRLHELAELNKQKTYAEKNFRDIVDELDRQYENMKLTVQNGNQNAKNKKIRVENDIVREFNRNQAANAYIKRENTYPRYIPPRETPRETPNCIYKFNASDENNIQNYYYKVLGVAHNASRQEIIKGYRAKSLLYHTDRHSADLTKKEQQDMFQVINRAYHLLSVPENEIWKKKYDEKGNSSGWVQVETMKSSFVSSEYNPYRVIQ